MGSFHPGHPAGGLQEQLNIYSESGAYPFHMPGHKRNPDWFVTGSEKTDITEIWGFDDLHDPSGILFEEMERAAAFYGTKATIFSVNGSTAAILAAVSAAAGFSDRNDTRALDGTDNPAVGTAFSRKRPGKVVVAENCHRSVFHAVFINRLEMISVPAKDPAGRLAGGGSVCPEDVERIFESEEERSGGGTISAVIITSPTYDGIVSNVRVIAEVAHRHGAVLIVDEAHGAHFSLHPYFPESAVRCGADLVIQSLHKTLPAMTQTALLHNVTGRIPTERLQFYMDIFETSSPSYVLMASMTACLRAIEQGGAAMFEGYIKRLKDLRLRLRNLKHLELLESGSYAAEIPSDPSKILIGIGTSGLTGPELYDLLRTGYGLEMEMKAPDYVLAITTVADTEEGFERLAAALEEIDRNLGSISEEYSHEADQEDSYPEDLFPGKISDRFIDVYPPGIPLLKPGDIVPEEFPQRILNLKRDGLTVRGLFK